MRKAPGRVLFCLCAIVLMYVLAAVIGAVIPAPGTQATGDDTVEIHLVKGPIHYDFLVPLTPLARARLDDLQTSGVRVDQPHAQWLLVGWGARGFYTTTGSYSDVTFGAVLKGLTGDRAVLRVDAVGPLRQDIQVPSIRLSQAQFEMFLSTVLDSFARTDQGQLIPMNVAGFTSTDQFFEAKGRFNVFSTCNVWIGETLRAAQVRFGVWVPLPYSVTLSRWLYQSDME